MTEFYEYQKWARTTAKDSAMTYDYLIPGLCAEAGEVADKYAKWVRDGGEFPYDKMMKEIGDCVWFLAMICEMMGYDFQSAITKNIEKLESRKLRGMLGGSGDDR